MAADPKRSGLVPLSLAVPGWKGQLIPNAVEKTARGVQIEQERLRGSRFLVIIRRYELGYDGSTEYIEIPSGHEDVESAVASAQVMGAQCLVEMGRRLDPERGWMHQHAEPRWPKVKPTWQGKQLPVFVDRLGDGVGWNAVEVTAAVVPSDPTNPINVEVIDTIDMMFETVRWFGKVADGVEGHPQG